MKKLVLITGAPGVGKTTVCKELFSLIDGCAWLDSDWCWMLNPWHAKSGEQKRYVENIFGQILRGYFMDDATTTIVFGWVMREPFMFQLIFDQLKNMEYELIKIALVCERQSHMDRMRKDGRRIEQAENPDDMKPYYELDAKIIDVSELSAVDAAKEIIQILQSYPVA